MFRPSFTGNTGPINMRAVEKVGLDEITVQVMEQAFNLACSRLIRAGVLDSANIERMQRLAAEHLVRHARRGERDEWRLARRAIFAVSMAAANERIATAGRSPAAR